MKQLLESDLREALSSKAASIPTQAHAGLHGIDYHPRTARTLPRVTVASLAGLAASTGVIASVVVLGSAQPAFAGWSSSPTPASALQTSAADTACRAQLNAAPGLPGTAEVRGWSQVTSDVRGPFTLVIYESGDNAATCLSGPSITMVSRSSPDGGSMSGSQSGGGAAGPGQGSSTITSGAGSGSIKHMTIAQLHSTSQGPFTLVEGQLDPGVRALTLVRSDGEHVQASTGNDWFVAWWPGDLDATSVEVTTAAGVTTQPLGRLPQLPTGNGSCAPSSATSPSTACTGGGAGGPRGTSTAPGS